MPHGYLSIHAWKIYRSTFRNASIHLGIKQINSKKAFFSLHSSTRWEGYFDLQSGRYRPAYEKYLTDYLHTIIANNTQLYTIYENGLRKSVDAFPDYFSSLYRHTMLRKLGLQGHRDTTSDTQTNLSKSMQGHTAVSILCYG